MRLAEWKLSEPPRRMAALPALRQSAPASAVTAGRLSNTMPMTPSGTATRSMIEAVGPLETGQHRDRRDRASRRDGLEPRGDPRDAAGIECEPVDVGRRRPACGGLGDVAAVRGEDLAGTTRARLAAATRSAFERSGIRDEDASARAATRAAAPESRHDGRDRRWRDRLPPDRGFSLDEFQLVQDAPLHGLALIAPGRCRPQPSCTAIANDFDCQEASLQSSPLQLHEILRLKAHLAQDPGKSAVQVYGAFTMMKRLAS